MIYDQPYLYHYIQITELQRKKTASESRGEGPRASTRRTREQQQEYCGSESVLGEESPAGAVQPIEKAKFNIKADVQSLA